MGLPFRGSRLLDPAASPSSSIRELRDSGDHHRCAARSGVAVVVQVGCLCTGWYSNDLLDNLTQPSAEAIVPEFQDLRIDQWRPMSPTPSDETAFKVAWFEPNHLLMWQQPVSSWVWTLTPIGDGGTRLVTRLRIVYDWHHRIDSVLSLVLNEFGDFPMMRRMLLGIKRRAETMTEVDRGDLIAVASSPRKTGGVWGGGTSCLFVNGCEEGAKKAEQLRRRVVVDVVTCA